MTWCTRCLEDSSAWEPRWIQPSAELTGVALKLIFGVVAWSDKNIFKGETRTSIGVSVRPSSQSLYLPVLSSFVLQSIIKSVTLAVWVASAGLFSLFSWFWKVYMNATLGWWVRCWERLATCQAFTLSWRCPTTSSGDFLASEPKVGKEERYNLNQ